MSVTQIYVLMVSECPVCFMSCSVLSPQILLFFSNLTDMQWPCTTSTSAPCTTGTAHTHSHTHTSITQPRNRTEHHVSILTYYCICSHHDDPKGKSFVISAHHVSRNVHFRVSILDFKAFMDWYRWRASFIPHPWFLTQQTHFPMSEMFLFLLSALEQEAGVLYWFRLRKSSISGSEKQQLRVDRRPKQREETSFFSKAVWSYSLRSC